MLASALVFYIYSFILSLTMTLGDGYCYGEKIEVQRGLSHTVSKAGVVF